MSFLDFPKTNYIKTVNTGETPRMGSFKTAKNIELQYIRATIFINGTITSEQFRINVCSDSTFQSIVAQSDWADLSNITGLTDPWLGWVRADFNRQNINKNRTYYPYIEMNNYTRNADIFYIGFLFDFPFPIYENSELLFYNHPLQMQIFGYVDRSEQ